MILPVIRAKVILDLQLYSSMHKSTSRDVYLHTTSPLPISSAA